jgi:hypothetical protein
MQRVLKRAGYNVVVDGKMGAQTRSARDAYARGKPPKQFNDWWARKQGTRAASRGAAAAGAATRAAITAASKKSTAPKTQSKKTGPVVDESMVGTPISEGLAQQGATLMPGDAADKLAGLEYDTQLRDLGIEKARQPVQQRQNEADIGNWYDQALTSQATAGERDKEINAAGTASVTDAVSRILSSLGGGANEGAGVVGAAGATAVGTLAALGSNQERYNADLVPLLQTERSGALSRERAMGSTRAQDLALKLSGLQGEKGASRASHQLEMQQYNNEIRDRRLERLMQIRAANNSLAQQQFQNKLALGEADMAAKGLGLRLMSAMKPANPQAAIAKASQNVIQMFADPNSGEVSRRGQSIQQVVAQVKNGYAQAGLQLNDPAVQQAMYATTRTVLPNVAVDARWFR